MEHPPYPLRKGDVSLMHFRFAQQLVRTFAGAQDDILDRGVYKQKREPVKTDSLSRAENEARTRDPNLGKVMLYQLSYFRKNW